MNQLTRVRIEGYRSIRKSAVDLKELKILIGANGPGKSNLVSFFRLISFMATGALQEHIGREGGSHSLLFRGPKRTPQIVAALEFTGESGFNEYALRLIHGAPESMVFGEERLTFHRTGAPRATETQFGAGHKESERDRSAKLIFSAPTS